MKEMLQISGAPESYRQALNLLLEELPASDLRTIVYSPCQPGKLSVRCDQQSATISAGSLSSFLRGVSFALTGKEVDEETSLKTLGLMLDCSRNRVFTVSYVKKVLRFAALCGYNFLMLYIEDVYELPDEPAFGYMRGRYTAAEIQELSQYAELLGLEFTTAIQTLGHLQHLFTHYQYSNIHDATDILLADAPETYALIEKMVRFQAENLQSTRIHIGMDEAHYLGRGKYLDQHGWRPPADIFMEHLQKVCAICEKYQLKPMIWTDMLYKFGDWEALARQLPKDVTLCYWNYSATDAAVYAENLEKHKILGRQTVMTNALATYNTFAAGTAKYETALPACVKACDDTHTDQLIITVWGDAGAFCNMTSALAGVDFAAAQAYHSDAPYQIFQFLTGEQFSLYRECSKLYTLATPSVPIPAPGLFWQDPIQAGIHSYCFSKYPDKMAAFVQSLQETLAQLSNADLSESLQELQAVIGQLLYGIQFRQELLELYRNKNYTKLLEFNNQAIPTYQEKIRRFDQLFRHEWLHTAKPFGLEIIQRRNAGLISRLDELAQRIADLANHNIDAIDELDEALNAANTPNFYPGPPVFSACLETY